MECSSCKAQSHNLSEYSTSVLDAKNRKTIQTLYLCAVCRIMLLIKPGHIAARAQQAKLAAGGPRRVA